MILKPDVKWEVSSNFNNVPFRLNPFSLRFWTGGSSTYEKEMYFDDNGNSRFNLFAYMMLSRKASENIRKHVRQALHKKSQFLQKDAPIRNLTPR